MDPFKNYFCDRLKRYFELNDLIEIYTLIRILWEHNVQNVVVDIPILLLRRILRSEEIRDVNKRDIFVTSWSVTYRIYRIIAKYATSNLLMMDFVCFIVTSYFALCLQTPAILNEERRRREYRRYIKVIYGWRLYIKMIYRRWGMMGSRTRYNIWFLLANYIPRILPLGGINVFSIPHVNFQQCDWSICCMTILNVIRQCLKAVKFVVEMEHSV